MGPTEAASVAVLTHPETGRAMPSISEVSGVFYWM